MSNLEKLQGELLARHGLQLGAPAVLYSLPTSHLLPEAPGMLLCLHTPDTSPQLTALNGKPHHRFVVRSHAFSRFPTSFEQTAVSFWLAILLSHAAQMFSLPSAVSTVVPRQAQLRELRQQGNCPFLALIRAFINSTSIVVSWPRSPLPMVTDDPFLSSGTARRDFT